MSKSEKGFTLIELMIVIAIIAIIAAIAIPGLLQSQRASNERNASSSLKTLATAEADFRANDRDFNRVQDFWTGNIAGLYGIVPLATSDMIKLIEISVGSADYAYSAASATTMITTMAVPANTNTWMSPSAYAISSAKAGYWYKGLNTTEEGGAFRTDTQGVTDANGTQGATGDRNHTKFGFMAFPDSFSSGRALFFVNEGNTIFKRPVIANVKPAATVPTLTVLTASGYAGSATNAAEDWPTDTELKSLYAKLD